MCNILTAHHLNTLPILAICLPLWKSREMCSLPIPGSQNKRSWLRLGQLRASTQHFEFWGMEMRDAKAVLKLLTSPWQRQGREGITKGDSSTRLFLWCVLDENSWCPDLTWSCLCFDTGSAKATGSYPQYIWNSFLVLVNQSLFLFTTTKKSDWYSQHLECEKCVFKSLDFIQTCENKIWKNSWSIWRTAGTLQYLLALLKRGISWKAPREVRQTSLSSPEHLCCSPSCEQEVPFPKDFRTSGHIWYQQTVSFLTVIFQGELWFSFKSVSEYS